MAASKKGSTGGGRSLFTIDLASDHVHSRLVSGAIWMIIPAMLAQVLLRLKTMSCVMLRPHRHSRLH